MARTPAKAKKVVPPPPLIPPQVERLLPYLLLVIAVLLAYGNVFDNEFLYDDESLILKNSFIQNWHHIGSIFSTSITAGANIPGGFYRPLQIFIYLIVHQLFGLSHFAYHALNVGFHAANACLVYALGRRLRFRKLAIFLGALLWALHPVHVEVIAYASGLGDPLYVFFCLIGLIALIPRFTQRGMIVAAICMILGLLS